MLGWDGRFEPSMGCFVRFLGSLSMPMERELSAVICMRSIGYILESVLSSIAVRVTQLLCSLLVRVGFCVPTFNSSMYEY